MLNYLLKLFIMLIFSAFIIFYYYKSKNGIHIENFDGYFLYVVFLSIFYGFYKYFQINSNKDVVIFTPLKIFGYFIGHLTLLSILFFYYNGINFGNAFSYGLLLTIKIFFYSLFPIIVLLVSLGFAKSILSKCFKFFYSKSTIYKFVVSLSFGLFSFVFLLTIAGMLGFYNYYSVFVILGFFGVFGFKEIKSYLESIFDYKIELESHKLYSKNVIEKINPKLLSTEFLFIVISFLLSINLISIFRPFPIGWDDLGAYMNYPHLMASEGSVGFLGSMMSWQTFTGIGYMFGNPTLAFFFNNIGGFVSVIVITLIVNEIFKGSKKTFINLGLLASTLFISMPMIVFQQAKDMKLDAGLFFISITALYILFDFYNNYKKIELSKKEILKLFLVIGLLLGFAFTIKFTSLLLISAVIGVLFFTRLGILGFLGYLFIYFSIFTYGNLWDKMNVVTNFDNDFRVKFSLISAIIAIAFLVSARLKTKKRFRRFIPRLLFLIFGIIVAISPWAINNINQAGKIGINQIISGKSESFIADYSKIYNKKQLEKIENKSELSRGISSSGTTTNEDFGRYFGYEKGINNYVKLPWNLTMQTNQGGEFTNIGFIFLALLPSILLFLPFSRKEYSLGVYLLLFFEVLLFLVPQTSLLITKFLSQITLPFGYIIILLLFLLPLIFLIPTIQKEKLEKLFKINLVFTIFYTFLWGISAFGVVWYGIVMYFNFILMIIFGIYYISTYNFDDDISSEEKEKLRFFGTLVVFAIILVYIFMNVFPHGFNNLKKSGYIDYKKGKISVIEAPFLYHKEYLPMLFSLNIDNDKQKEFIYSNLDSKVLVKIFEKYKVGDDINKAKELLDSIISGKNVDKNLKKSAKRSLNNFYAGILEPSLEFKNPKGIYRMGTFMKYFISQNYKRLYEDSLLNKFDKYFYNKNSDITISRIKKFGLDYLLVDLNAATIDRDPRHDLTRRYENLLKTFNSDKLELIDTDSVCLKVALENYKKEHNLKTYMLLAGVNYESFLDKNKVILRTKKQVLCYKAIITLIDTKQVNKNNYNYLLKYKSYLDKMSSEAEKIGFLKEYVTHGNKVLFKIK